MGYIGKKPTPVPLTASDVTDGIISNAKLAQDIISAETALAVAPADTDEFLLSDAGTLKRIDYSLIKGGGITVADQFRVTAAITSNQDPISSNIERIDTAGQGGITDNQMSVSSGIFTFPLTGIYLVSGFATATTASGGDNVSLNIAVTTDNSSYNAVAFGTDGNAGRSSHVTCSSLIDVTDTSNVKVKFVASSISSGSQFNGHTDYSQTCFTFIRLADT